MNTCVVFLVDRNPIHSSLIKYHLNINHILNVQTFQSGEECIYRIQKGIIPDYLITDYDIGNYTGFDFLEKVKTINPGIQVVFFSAYEDPILVMRLLEAGASDYISKTGKLEAGLSELIKNVKFLYKAVHPVNPQLNESL